jgi:hypothetical protein
MPIAVDDKLVPAINPFFESNFPVAGRIVHDSKTYHMRN